MKIFDALHVYNVADVIDKDNSSNIKILWTADFTKAVLSINNYYHAVFDFKEKAGYCKNAISESKRNCTLVSERVLTDELLDKLSKA